MAQQATEETQPKWTPQQRHTLFAGVASWTLDAFDYFLLVFLLTTVADAFHTSVVIMSLAITFTLIMRPVGALIFGPLAERFGRKPILVLNIVLYALIELASALAPNLPTFFALRVVFGIAMGGVWGVASALTLETVPKRARGSVSGVFQAGYPLGYLFAAILYGLFADVIGWRGFFMMGTVPILLAIYIFFVVPESPAWLASRNQPGQKQRTALLPTVVKYWRTMVFAVVLMAAFNYFSHGTQDIYPTFLEKEHGLGPDTISLIAISYNIAAILGGVLAGSLSQRFGRKRVIIIFAALSLPCIPLWAFASGSLLLGVGAFLMQFMVQGAWGVIPAFLNELVPEGTRAVLPGFVYQLGNVIAAPNATIQASIAAAAGMNYGLALALVAGIVAIIIIVMMSFAKETRDKTFGDAETAPAG